MTRISKDLYKTKTGDLIAVDQTQEPPQEAQLYTGYNYEKQEWYFQGKPDTRTLEELKEKTVCKCGHGCDYERTQYEKVNKFSCSNSRRIV